MNAIFFIQMTGAVTALISLGVLLLRCAPTKLPAGQAVPQVDAARVFCRPGKRGRACRSCSPRLTLMAFQDRLYLAERTEVRREAARRHVCAQLCSSLRGAGEPMRACSASPVELHQLLSRVSVTGWGLALPLG